MTVDGQVSSTFTKRCSGYYCPLSHSMEQWQLDILAELELMDNATHGHLPDGALGKKPVRNNAGILRAIFAQYPNGPLSVWTAKVCEQITDRWDSRNICAALEQQSANPLGWE